MSAPMPATYRKKLIEVALPLEDINKASAREKSIRHGHPSTLHLWWSRKPLATARAVLFGQMVDDPSSLPEEFPSEAAQEAERERLFNIIRALVKWESTTNEAVLHAARVEISRSAARNHGASLWQGMLAPAISPGEVADALKRYAPPVLDPFAGGGSIPLEAQRLGLEAHASDLNPVAVLINKAMIEIPPQFAGMPPVNPDSRKMYLQKEWRGAQGLAEDVRYYGKWMRDEAFKRIGHLYPKVTLPKQQGGGEATVIAWLWARTVTCPNPACGAQMVLTSKWTLSTKKGKEAWVEPVVDRSATPPAISFAVRQGPGVPEGTVNRTGARCIACGTSVPFDHVRTEGKAGRMGAQMMAIVAEGKGGRVYLPPNEGQVAVAEEAQPHDVPDTNLPEQALGFRVQGYGMTRHRDLFTARQLVALTTFSDLVGEARARVVADSEGNAPYADAVATYLALAVDKAVDRSSTICSWDSSPKMEALRNTFARQAIPMTWDFAEGNPFSASSGNWTNNVEWVTKVIDDLCPEVEGIAKQLDATAAINGVTHPLISTDPPYCLAPGTLVYTPDGLVPIERVQVGDRVLSHKGRFALVTRTYRRPYSGRLHQLKVAHANTTLLITSEHPIYGIRTEGCAIHYAEYCRPQCAWMAQNNGKCSSNVADHYALDWIPAADVRRSDLIFLPTLAPNLVSREDPIPQQEMLQLADYLPMHEYVQRDEALHYQKASSVSLAQRSAERLYQCAAEVPLTPDLCRLVGYFVAEGYARVEHDGGTIQFTFHADEHDFHQDVERLMEHCFGLYPGKHTDNRPNNNHSVRLNFYSKPIAQLLRAWCYTPDGHKRFPAWAMDRPESHVKELVRGYWAGDGSRTNAAYMASTNSLAVAGQLRMLLQQLGIISRFHARSVHPTVVNGKPVIPTGEQYMLLVSGPSLIAMAAIVGDPKKAELRQARGGQHGHRWPGGYLLPVRRADTVDFTGDVYNLETEDQSYTTVAGCVHNCDNIGYSDLSDFFYVWLRRSLQGVYPSLFDTVLVPKANELVANRYRFDGSYDEARRFFENGLHDVFTELCSMQEPEYPTAVYYAYKQQEEVLLSEDGSRETGTASTGWESVLNSLMSAGFSVHGTWPMRSELSNRPIASGTNALASSIVLVCRPRSGDAPTTTRRDFLNALKRELPGALRDLQRGNIAPVDLAQASIGPGMAVFSRYSKVLESDGKAMRVRTALQLINQTLDEVLAEQEGEFDSDTRFAVTWFEQYGMGQGEFGVADVLARAKDTSVGGLDEAGVLEAKGGKVRLLRRDELPEKWSPQQDHRLSIWKVTQRLIQALMEGGGAQAAAQLLDTVGSDYGEKARDLAYRLYTTSERRKWTQEAFAYNTLVTEWHDIVGGVEMVRQQAQAVVRQGKLM